jgi:uncharacterized integral membrane protein
MMGAADDVTEWGRKGDTSTRLGAGAIATLVGVALLVVFMLQNRQDVRFELFFWGFDWPLWLIILGSAVMGAFIWFAAGVVRRHNRRKSRREDRG